MNLEPMQALRQEVPTCVLLKSVDEVMIDYAIMSAKSQQSAPAEKAADHIRNMKLLRDTLKDVFTES